MKECVDNLIELFGILQDWSERYNYLIELGDLLPPMPETLQIPANRIECNSKLFFSFHYIADICHVEASSNTPIPAGLAGLLYHIFNGRSKNDVNRHINHFFHFIKASEILDHLSPSRRDALLSMIKKIEK